MQKMKSKKEADVSQKRESCVWSWFLLPKPEEWSTYESIDIDIELYINKFLNCPPFEYVVRDPGSSKVENELNK